MRAADMPARYRIPERPAPAPRAHPASPPRVFGASRGVSFVSADGATYEPPVVFLPSDPPAIMMQQASPARDQSPWLRGQRGGSALQTPSPAAKRTRSPGLQRDSLKQRYSPGRPGSRRHQRWSNDQALREDLSEEELKQLYSVDWRSALSELFDGEDKMQQWQEFCEAPEERQMAILRGLDKAQCSKLRRCERPHERYDKIDRRVKALLKRGVGRHFVCAFEKHLCRLVYGEEGMAETRGDEQDSMQEDVSLEIERTRGGASLVLNDSLHRLLAHAVCLYHSVQSFSRDCDGGGAPAASKKLVILWPHSQQPAAVPTDSTPPNSRGRGWRLTAPDTYLHELVGH